ncbi:MAG TPA: HD domain-containing protein [Nitrospirae bacterium]|nr:HD domain-containing protein [Nitrospirota bacterium]
MNVRTKIIGATVLILAICLVGTSVFMARLAEQRMVTANSSHLSSLGGVAQREFESLMKGGHAYRVQDLLENMLKTPVITSARILSTKGIIMRSGTPGEAGQKVPLFKMPDEGPKTIRQQSTLTHLIPIKNRSECFACHGEIAKHLGVLELGYDISPGIEEVVSTNRFLLMAGLLTLTIVAGTLIVTITRVVSYPVELFSDCMKSVREGSLNTNISLRGRDEIARLGQSFNTMMDEVKALYDRTLKKERDISRVKAELDHKVMLEELNTQLQHKVKEVESANKAVLSLSKELKHKNVELERMVDRLKRINEVGSVLTSIINHEELLKIIIKTASETLRVLKGTIHVQKGTGKPITIAYRANTGFVDTDSGSVELDSHFQEMLRDGKQVFQNEGAASGGTAKKTVLGVPLRMKGQIIGGILLEESADGSHITHDDLEVLETMSNQAVVALENAWLYETVKSNYFGTIQSLVNALEASDRYTKGHSERVRFLGMELARYLGLDYRELEVLEHAAILHDIGKIGIDSTILNKEDELTNTEFSLIRAHPIIGDEILGPIGTLEGVRTTILQHHERYDGKGYPYGISGEEITTKARILAVIDTFDAMLTDRPYRKALSLEQALDEVKKGSGTQFDPAVVSAFFQMIKENEELMETTGYTTS